MSPLPDQLPQWLKSSPLFPHIESAYNVCLKLERKIQSTLDKSRRSAERVVINKNLIYVRVLGYLLHHGPSLQARQYVTKEIVSCVENEDNKIIELGQMYFEHYIRACVLQTT